MAEARLGAYWAGSDRLIPDKGDLRDYQIEISSDKDLLGPAPSYVLIRDLVRRLCHRMIAYSISGRGQAPEKVTGVELFYLRSMDYGTTNVSRLLAQYLFRYAKGRKSGTRLSGGHFIGHLAMHFGLAQHLHEVGDTWDWVGQGPERQQAAAAGAHEADEAGLPGVIVTIEQSRVSTWLISCMTQLMDASGHTYQPFDSTLVGSSRLSFQRRVRPRTGDARTTSAPHIDVQPDP
ncbi:hypothetical protein Tco_0595778 [Tanacetum coccineum]